MGNIEAVQLLLKLGVPSNTKDINGLTPYDFAKRNEFQDILDVLNEHDIAKAAASTEALPSVPSK